MKHLKLLLACVGLLLLPACEVMDTVSKELGSLDEPLFATNEMPDAEKLIQGGNCPQVQIVNELSAMSDFVDQSGSDESALVSRVRFETVKSTCDYAAKSVTVDLQLGIEGILGPKARVSSNDKPYFSYPFFVAVTAPDGEIMAKEVFSASMTFEPGQDRHGYTESLRQIIPVPSQSRGARYSIMVGFQLTEDQLAYNRAVIAQMAASAEAASIAVEEPPAPAE